MTITETLKEQFILKTQKCTWWKAGCCFSEQEKGKGLLGFCSSSMLIQVSSVARLFFTQYLQKKLKQSTQIALSAQKVIVVTRNAFEWLQKERVTKDPGATRDKLVAQPGRERQFCNPDPRFLCKSYIVPRGHVLFLLSRFQVPSASSDANALWVLWSPRPGPSL